MQIRTMDIQPHLGAFVLRINTRYQPPKTRGVIELEEVTDLVSGEIVKHERWSENETPRKRQHARARTGAPAALFVTCRYACDGNANLAGIEPARCLQVAQGLALEKVVDPAIEMDRLSCNAKQALPIG